ncbi:flagellin lysine-N-methylase [Clostridium weizhouense]|uniref:Flagellin lysine-N-methylase n=1 Tax=Clostridium weizhouense TaxID=2859781 RepID=A0ABS7ALX4_9CLOT|nr:flagellin lysine-N-methylase [Clostridium weizhouense]MBW6409564.1 flagellin lysine-N-methylase [Clostridium weizhouense]
MKVNIFMPKYMLDFKCINSKCTDTCCAGWDINIDEATYNKYINSDGIFKELIDGKFVKNNNEHESFNHGFMILKDERRCPFLNSNMLCDIHGELGEENLCITCKSYPRVFNLIDNIYEKSGLSSCEEICIRAFLNKDKMEFIELEEELEEDNIEIRRIIDSEAFEGTESILQYFWDIRVISINIMQLREFSIEERLSILKNFYNQIEKAYNEYKFIEIEEILENFNEESMNYNLLKGLAFNENNEFYIKICDEDLIKSIRSLRLKQCVNEYREGILNKKNICQYLTKESKYFNDLKEYDYIFENYIVNQIFKDLIPFNKGKSLIKSINVLINIYRLIKAYVIGISINSNKKITDKEIVRVIQALGKDMEHNKVFVSILEE